jgi:hypothetical protein
VYEEIKMNPLGIIISFFVFVLVCVILVLILRWGLAKAGIAIDPTLLNIIYLIVILVLVLMFLNFTGIYDIGTAFHSHSAITR